MRYFILLFCLLVSACATTELNGIMDPSYRGRFEAKKILVYSENLPIGRAQTAERALVEALGPYQVQIISGLYTFPPIRKYTLAEIAKSSKKAGIDAILILKLDKEWLKEDYIPPIYVPGDSYSRAYEIGNTINIHTRTNPGYTLGGNTLYKPNMAVSVSLKIPAPLKTIWIADIASAGSGVASFDDLWDDVAKKITLALAGEGIIKQP